jgi:hypothetical protein
LNNLRETAGRLALFLLCVVLFALCLGMLLSMLHLSMRTARNVVLVAAFGSAIGSYLASYKPGWLYNSLVETSKEDQ